MTMRNTSKGNWRASAALCVASVIPGAAHAEDPRWFANLGVAHVMFHESATLSAAGTPVPGGNASASDNTTLALELGYKLTPQWSASATIGVPPTSKVAGSGTASAFGEMGRVKYGPLVLGGQYHLAPTANIQPYVGAGAVYYRVLSSRDGAIEQLDVKSGWGSMLQAGVRMPLNERYSLFFDVKKLFLKSSAAGLLPAMGGAPVSAQITLNPVVVHLGLSVNF